MSEPGLARLARALRSGGVRIGSGAVVAANAALAAVGFARRDDVHDALRASLIRDPADLELFEHVFEACFPRRGWQVPDSAPLLPRARGIEAAPASRRYAASLAAAGAAVRPSPDSIERRSVGTSSAMERLATRDFEQMSPAELGEARRLLAALPPRTALRRARRWRTARAPGRLDVRRMLRARPPGLPLYRAPTWRPRDLVLLVDISGSMALYARQFLHLAHALTHRGGQVETFVFATRLTRITRDLARLEPDIAMRSVTRSVPDWDSGTRIGECLATFNREWGRRVLARSPRVVLMTDGLECADPELLGHEAGRLVRSCHELVWVNPLRRSERWAPLAAGAAMLARHAGEARPAHSVRSLLDLARSIDQNS